MTSPPAVHVESYLRAGFSSVDITPAIGVAKIGWLRHIKPTRILDRLFARVCSLETHESTAIIVALDTLSVSRQHVAQIRAEIQQIPGLEAAAVMVAATHNHAGPALVRLGDVPADMAYRSAVTSAVVAAVIDAASRAQEAEVGFGQVAETSVPHNRRVVLRDGTVRTHASLQDPDALYIEGPVDPILTTIGIRSAAGGLLGALLNFTCHPTHHGDDEYFSAGYPGAVVSRLTAVGVPNVLFLNGALGNIHWIDPANPDDQHGMDQIAATLASAAERTLEQMAWQSQVRLRASSRHVLLPFREFTVAEINGATIGAQRLVDPTVYDRAIPRLLEEAATEHEQRAEVQVIAIDGHALVGVPAELFVELGLAIKERAYPVHAMVVGLANGMVGYVPHEAAFARGGYETTLGDGSKLDPHAGQLLVDAALAALAEATTRTG